MLLGACVEGLDVRTVGVSFDQHQGRNREKGVGDGPACCAPRAWTLLCWGLRSIASHAGAARVGRALQSEEKRQGLAVPTGRAGRQR